MSHNLRHSSKEDEGDVIVQATIRLLSSMNAPLSSLPLARRLMSSSIGQQSNHASLNNSEDDDDRRNGGSFAPSLLRNINRSYHKYYQQQKQQRGSSGSSRYDDETRRSNMYKLERYYERLERIYHQNNDRGIPCKMLQLFSNLIGAKGMVIIAPRSLPSRNIANNTMGEEEEALRGAATIRNNNDYIRTTTTRSSSGYDEEKIPNSYYGKDTQQHGVVNIHESTERESQLEKKKMYEEGMLLRETIYALQGIDGSRVKFLINSTNNDDNNDNNNHQATVLSVEEEGLRIYPRLFRNHGGMLDAIKLIGECGWCYKTIQRTIEEISNSTTATTVGNHTNGGMVARALAASLSEELIEYHRLIAILESQVDSSTTNRNNTSRSLTFKRLLVWIRPAFHRLKILSTLIDGIYPFINSSGSLCSAIHQHTLHIQLGMNDNHGQMMHRISNKSMVPLFEFIFRWVFYGHIASTNKEDFFIVENKSVSDAMLWAENGRYALQHCHVPCFLNNSSGGGGGSANNLANVILNVGKAVNFMNKCFPNTHNHNNHHHGGGTWDLLTHLLQVQNLNNHHHHERTQHTTPTFTSLAAKLGFSYTHYKTLLPNTISQASTLMHSHIVSQLMNTDQHQYSLFENLHALKSFLLLSQGDFLQSLMDGLGPLLDNHNNHNKHSNLLLHKHTIHNTVENALRNTNAKHFSDVILSKVRVRMLKPKHHHTSDKNNSHWDVFSLDYDISPPLTAIVHPQCQFQYRKMFTLLWRLKKLEWNLNRTWRQATFIHHAIMARSRHFHTRRDMGGLDDDDEHDDGRSSNENQRWKRYALAIRKSASTRHAILHLVGNLQRFLMHEVIEGSWKVLMQKLSNTKVCLTLDDVIHAHEHYLDTIVSKSMLFNATSTATDDDHTNEAGASGGGVASQLSLVLDTASRFVTVQQHLFTDVLHNLQQAAERRREAERRIQNGEWGYETAEPQNEDIIGDWDHDNISDDPETEQLQKTRLEAVHTTSREFEMAIRTFLTMLNDCSEGGGGATDQDVSSSYSSPTATNSNTTLEQNGGRSTTTTTTTSSQQRFYQNDDALRFLTFRLDFNQYYSIVR